MTIKIETALQPFMVPSYAREVGQIGKREDGFKEVPGHLLSELSAQVLSDMCDEFRAGVFTKAGKDDPLR